MGKRMYHTSTSLPDLPLWELNGGEENVLGTESYVEGLADFISGASAPLAIALQGEWGSGKTSFMREIEFKLCSDPQKADQDKFISAWINTWEYSLLSTPENTVVRILQKLVNDLVPVSLKDKTHQILSKLVGGVLNVGLRAAGNLTIGTDYVGSMAAESIDGLISKENQIAMGDLRQTLEEGIDGLLQSSGAKGILIFVDDLDRLNPPVAVEILEILKNIFTLRKCIFVLAIDYDVVVKGLKPKFGELTDQNEREFRSFFDKIIQVPFLLPVSAYRPERLLIEALQQIGYISGYEAERAIQALLQHTDCFEIGDLVDLSNWTVGHNPRSIKRLLNSLSLMKCIAERSLAHSQDNQIDRVIEFALAGLQIAYPKFYSLFALEPDFRLWNMDLVKRVIRGFVPKTKASEEENVDNWSIVVAQICQMDVYLDGHRQDIIKILDKIDERLEAIVGEDDRKRGEFIRKHLDRSGMLGVKLTTEIESNEATFDAQTCYYHMRDKLWSALTKQGFRTGLRRVTYKSGGIYIWDVKGNQHEIDYRMSEVEGAFHLYFWMSLHIPFPENNEAAPLDLLCQEPFKSAVRAFDTAIEDARGGGLHLFEGSTFSQTCEALYAEDNTRENKFYWFDNLWYDFQLPSKSTLSAPEIVEGMCKIAVAAMQLVNAII